MTVNLSALAGAGQQFFDNNGTPLSGGKLYSYQAGTTTPQTTYTSASGATAHTNPIVLDSAGRVATGEIWLTSGQNYKFVLKTSAEVTIATWDNITGINGTGIATNADNVEYDPPFTGAVTSGYTVEDRLAQSVSVKDFGATGDGETDDTAAIQAAIDYVESTVPWGDVPTQTGSVGRKPAIYIPAGAYIINDTLQISQQNVTIYGDGLEASVLILDSNTDIPAINMGTFNPNPPTVFTSGPQDCYFSDFGIFNNHWGFPASLSTGTGIQNNGVGGLRLTNIRIFGFGVGVNGVYGNDYNLYNNVLISGCNIGMYQGPGGQQTQVNRLDIGNCTYGVILDRPAQIEFNMPVINNCEVNAILIEAPSNTSTRFLTSFGGGGVFLQSKIVFNSAWFEGNAGNAGDISIPTHFVYFNNQAVDAYRDIEINNPYVVAGSTGTKTTTSLVGTTGTGAGAQRVYVNTPVVVGDIQYWTFNPGGAWVLNNPRTANGFGLPLLRNTSVSVPVADAIYQNVRTSLPNTSSHLDFTGASGVVTESSADKIRYAFLSFNCQFVGSLDTSGNLTVDSVTSGSLAIGQTLTFDGLYGATGTITGGSGTSWTVSGIATSASTRTMYTYTRFYRMGMDVQNRRFFLGDPDNNEFSIGRSASVPTSGTYAAGSFVYNTAPSVSGGKTLLGWQRLTTGSGHVLNTDWSPCYVTNT